VTNFMVANILEWLETDLLETNTSLLLRDLQQQFNPHL